MAKGSTLVIIVALAGNLAIALAKFVASWISGSTAMLTEAIHSLVDTGDQVLLLVGQKRGARPPDARHPLGHGMETTLAEQLYESIYGKLLKLPDHLELYPAHFSGAACGKGLSGKAASTIGFERRFNPALQLASRADFVRFVLEGLPPQPPEFTDNRRRNLGEE